MDNDSYGKNSAGTSRGEEKALYRIVVADERSPRDGRYIELIGTYDPLQNPAGVQIKKERLEKWLRNGAQPTDTVARLIKKVSQATGA